MAFNCSDTRQRAYNRIDTSSPGGSWIDEKQFNKSLGGSAKGRKTLVGNWQEEAVLEGDMLHNGHELALLRKDGRFFKGGFESSAYLVSSENPADHKFDGQTTQRQSFNTTNGDVSGRLKPVGGIRQQLKAREVIEEARAMVSREKPVQVEPLTSTYRSAVAASGVSAPRRVVPDPLGSDYHPAEAPYAKESAITLYTGNPRTGAKMVVPGKTFATGANPLGRSTNFTYDKFAIGTL